MGRRRKSGALQFWLGAGLGVFVAASAVAIAAEFTYLRRRRFERTGMLDDSEETLVHDLSVAVHSGLEHISHAATELAHSFSDARRELVRFGLDPQGGSEDAGWYFDEDDSPQRARPNGPDYEQQWEK
jgi:hypothetical protein